MLSDFCRAGAVLAGASVCAAAPLNAQLNLGATAGAVRYEQVGGTGSLGINPDLTLTGTRLLWNLGGTATAAGDGSRSLEGATTLWAATPMVAQHVQLDGMAQASYTSPTGDSTSYSLTGFGEAAFTGDDYGIGVGGGAMQGTITGLGSISALRASARAW
jgi:hypothetical protein